MARTLSAQLTTEMNNLDRSPTSRITVERWLPEWTAIISGLSGGALEQYAHGHAAATTLSGGETILLRARSGSFTNPQNGTLYIAVIGGSNLDTPANWDSLFVSTGVTGLMYPAWSANSGANHGGSIAAVDTGSNFRVFYTKADGSVRYVDVSYAGAVGTETTIASLGTGVQLTSMQIAACISTEIFVLVTEAVEGGVAGWQKPTYTTTIRRYIFSGSWNYDGSFIYQPIIEAGLMRDGPDFGAAFDNTSDAGIRTQWGKRPCGGLAVSQLDSTNVLISLYATQWRRHGYDTHTRAVYHWIYNRNGYWEKCGEADRYDFNEGLQLNLGGFCRGSTIEGSHFVIWNRSQEPADYEQTATSQNLPRLAEVVIAKYSANGRHFSQWQYLGSQDDLTAASLVVVIRGGVKQLYALGWRAIYQSPEAAFLCSVSTPQDLAAYAAGWETEINNRQGGSLDIDMVDPSILTDANSPVKSGALARITYGITAEQVQIAQGYIDNNTPNLVVSGGGEFREGAKIQARPDLLLTNTRIEQAEEFLPRSVLALTPVDAANLTVERGNWQLIPMAWPELFFPGVYTPLNNRLAWRLLSFPVAGVRTNGARDTGATELWTLSPFPWQAYAGTWFKDIAWLNFPSMTEGVLETSVRFGNNSNQGNANFETKYSEPNVKRVRLYATVAKTNGIVTNISFSKTNGGAGFFDGYDGTPYPKEMQQQAIMAGLVCYAPETGKKYFFIWEYNSNFASGTAATANSSSFIRGPYTNEFFDSTAYSSLGTNMLYLIESDYNGSNWVNYPFYSLSASGLTGGQPADLRIQLQGSHLYCFYRAHSTGTRNNWRLAFSHRTGRFGPGRFGLVGRGSSPPQWHDLLALDGGPPMSRLFNNVDFWDIKASDGIRDETIEEHLRRFSWRGHTSTRFTALVSEASRTVSSGAVYNYGVAAENLTLDFLLDPTANGVEAGVFVRGVGAATPQNECIRMGLVPSSSPNVAGSSVNYYVIKRRYSGGSEVTSARDYAPIPIQYSPTHQLAVRITVRGAFYSVYVYGSLVAHFIDTTELGLYFGLYSTGGGSTFRNIYAPELYEIVGRLPVENNQAADEVIGNIIGRRRIKGFFDYSGAIKWSYFATHPTGPTFDNTMWQSEIRRSPRYISKLRVQGDNAHAIYQSDVLAMHGQRYQVINNPDIIYREFAYKEAQTIVAQTAEQQVQATFEGLPDLRVEPEDVCNFIVARQGVAGDFIIDDVKLNFKMGDQPESAMKLSTRQTVVL